VTQELTEPGFLHDQHSMAHIFINLKTLLFLLALPFRGD
jgi:hypothetical protein